MTRSVSTENFNALKNRQLVARDFVRFIVRNRGDDSPVEDCYWSDVYAISAPVIDPDTGGTIMPEFSPGAGLISITDIPLVSTLTVQTTQIKLAQASSRVSTLVHAYDCKQGRVQIWRGMFDPSSRAIVAPAMPRFSGFIDQAPITTPKENEAGDVILTCISNTQELTRSNPDTSSDASQRLRNPTDNFFADAAVVPKWQQFWGRAGGPVRTTNVLSFIRAGMGKL
jgi:hypothetical protein